jgi:hypothetical protein
MPVIQPALTPSRTVLLSEPRSRHPSPSSARAQAGAVAPAPIPIPFRVRWREFRIQLLPVLWFLAALGAVVLLWPAS